MIELSKEAIYYSDGQLNPKILLACQKQLRKSFTGNIIACNLKPLNFGDIQIILSMERGYLAMFTQILTALEASTSSIVYFTEHDCLYDESNFAFTPPDKNKFYYNLNWWKIGKGDLSVHWDAVQVSGLCCYRDLAIDFYKKRVAEFDKDNFDRKFEPTVETQYETWWSEKPMIDIRHQTNTTYNKWKLDHFRKKETAVNFESSTIDKIPGWENLTDLIQ